jgi:type II secretory pathway component PulF
MTAMLNKLDLVLGTQTFRSRINNFYDELLENLRMNIPLSHFLDARREIAEKRGQKGEAVYDVIMQRMQEGGSLSDAGQGFIPDADIMMIRAGEHVARITDGVETAQFSSRAMTQIRAIVLKQMMMPVVLAVMLIAMMILFGVMVIPKFLFIVPLNKLGYAYQVSYAFANMLQAYWWIFVPAMAAFAILLTWSVGHVTGPARLWLDRIPPFSIVRQYVSAGLLIKLSGLLRNNVTLDSAIELMMRDASAYERSHLEIIKYKLNNGDSLTTALDTGLVPHDVVDRLVSFEKAGSNNLEEIIKRIGFENIDKSLEAVERSVAKVSMSMKLVVFILLLWMVFNTFTLGSVISEMTRSAGR